MSLGTTVPVIAPWLGYEGVSSARPVRGGDAQWKAYGAALNHVLGHGCALIPWSRINTELDQNAVTTLQLYAWPRPQTRRRLWSMTYGVSVAFPPCLIRFTDPSGGTSDATINAATAATFTHYHLETVADTTANELAPTWTEVNDVGAPKLLWLACHEMPRPEIETAHLGVRLDALGQGRSIYVDDGVGPGAVAAGVDAAFALTSRSGLFTFARGHVDYLTMSSGSWAPVFASGCVPFVRARKETPSSTTNTVGAVVRASSSVGTTGTVRMTFASGGVSTFSITSGLAAAWIDNDVDIACDDLSTSTGYSATPDSVLIEWQRTGGAGAINLHSVVIGNG